MMSRLRSLPLRLGVLCLVIFFKAVAEVDVTPPLLVSLEISPTNIDLSTGPKRVSIVARFQDDLSGVESYSIRFASSIGGAPPSLDVGRVISAEVRNVSDITVTNEIVIEDTYSNGIWAISAYATDRTRNSLNLSSAGLSTLGLSPSLSVTGSRAIPIVHTVPRVVEFSFATNRVDVINDNRPVEATVGLRIEADQPPPTGVLIGLLSPNFRNQAASSSVFLGVEASEGVIIARYRLQFSFSQYVSPGAWIAVYSGAITPPAPVVVTTENLVTDFGAAAVLTVEGRDDSTPPEILSLSFSTNRVDTTSSNQTVSGTVRLADTGSGIAGAILPGGPATPPQVSLVLQSPSRSQNAQFQITSTSSNGNVVELVGQIPFLRHCEDGEWSVVNLFFSDNAGNPVTLDADKIFALGFPTKITVVSKPNLKITSRPVPLISWRRPATPWSLEEYDPLSGAGWRRVENTQAIGDSNVLLAHADSASRLFRLVGP